MPRSKTASKTERVARVATPELTKPQSVIWTRFSILSVDWKAIITNPSIDPDLEGNNGYTFCDDAIIAINADVDDSRKPETFFHELLHAIKFSIGYEYTLGRVYEKQKFDAEVREEARVALLSPVLYDVFTRNGWVKLPPIPKEAANLRTKK